jgi:signal transduction histidine kinase/CheY-like chemotaxis protein
MERDELDVEVIAALLAGLGFLGAIAVASAGARTSGYWAISWCFMISAGILLALDPVPALQEASRLGASVFPGLQLAGAYRYVGARVPRWVVPVTLLIALTRSGVALAGHPEFSHASVVVAEAALLGWGGRIVLSRSAAARESIDWLLALGAAALCGAEVMDAVYDVGRPDGSVVWALWLVVGCTVGIVQTVGVSEGSRRRAVEKRRLREEHDRTAQRLESLGNMAGGIAHDFNNLLTALLGNVDLALPHLAPDHPARRHVEDIGDTAERAADLSSQMLAYASGRRLEPEAVDLSEVLGSRWALLRSAVSAEIRLEIDAGKDLPSVLADPTQLDQLIMNLVINAGEATPPGGVVSVSAEAVELTEPPNTVIGELETGAHLCLTVRDSGGGLQTADVSRIFDPFFSTKFTGRGLGLAVVQQIVRAHQGALAVASAPGETRFEVYLPVLAKRADESVAPPALKAARLGHVLVVDDDPAVLRTTSGALESVGHEVTAVNGGAEAVERLAHDDLRPSLLLLDATMPEVSAREVIAFVRETHPGLPILMMTGHDTERLSDELDYPEIQGWLRKPFRMRTLQERVGECLDS